MMKLPLNKAWVFGVAAMVLYSFCCNAPLFFNKYSSDSAIQVLMANDFHFSTDLYYWGQDRLGSLVPLLAALPVKLGCSPIYAVSIVQYLLMLGGFLFFSSFISRKVLRLLLCLVWFFPLAVFQTHAEIGHPYTGQLFFLGLSLYCFEKKFLKLRSPQWLFFSAFSFMLSVWMSDLMFFILPVYLAYLVFALAKVERNSNNICIRLPVISYGNLFALGGALLLGLIFLIAAKKTASASPPEYDQVFSGLSKTGAAFALVTGRMANALIFEVGNVLISCQALAACSLLLVSGVYFSIFHRGHERSPIGFFLAGSTIVSFIIVVTSHWVEMANYESRYFSFTFYLFLVFLITTSDRIRHVHFSRITTSLCVLLAIPHFIDNQVLTHQTIPYSKHLDINNLGEISRELGDCGILGDYWTSYNIASADPAHIIASSHDNGSVRKPGLAHEVMKKKNIFLVMDNWLGDFPQAIVQFGYFLKRSGHPFRTHDLTLCRYTTADSIQYPVASIGYRHVKIENENFAVKPDSTTYVHDHIFFGPLITLGPGRYHFSFETGSLNKLHRSDEITIDITNTFGEHVLWKKHMVLDGCFAFSKKFTFSFETRHHMPHFELRVFLNGRTQVYLKNITLSKEKE